MTSVTSKPPKPTLLPPSAGISLVCLRPAVVTDFSWDTEDAEISQDILVRSVTHAVPTSLPMRPWVSALSGHTTENAPLLTVWGHCGPPPYREHLLSSPPGMLCPCCVCPLPSLRTCSPVPSGMRPRLTTKAEQLSPKHSLLPACFLSPCGTDHSPHSTLGWS